MKRLATLSCFVFSLCLVFTSLSYAQNNQGFNRGKFGRNQFKRLYDTSKVVTIKVDVLEVNNVTGKRGKNQGLRLVVSSAGEQISVHMGPSWYHSELGMKVEVGDTLEITGSMINYNEKQTIIAAIVKTNSDTFVLRDENGFPNWRGRGRRR